MTTQLTARTSAGSQHQRTGAGRTQSRQGTGSTRTAAGIRAGRGPQDLANPTENPEPEPPSRPSARTTVGQPRRHRPSRPNLPDRRPGPRSRSPPRRAGVDARRAGGGCRADRTMEVPEVDLGRLDEPGPRPGDAGPAVEALPTERIWNRTSEPVLRLITWGQLRPVQRHYRDNIIVFAGATA